MASKFASSVDYGLMLSKRIYYGKGAATAPAPPAMSRSPDSYLPTAPMVYAVVPDPTAVDNPDVPSYQPYVHGRCDPPALVPLQMHEVAVEADCYLDTAFVSITGRWRLHCIMASRRCDCQVAIPMGEQGLLLGIEVHVAGRSYNSQLIIAAEMEDMIAEVAKAKGGNLLKSQTSIFRVPQVVGGSTISVKANWSQKLTYQGSLFCLSIPFTFPSYVNPVAGKMPKKEKVLLNVNSGTGIELLRDHTSHPLKDLSQEAGKLSCLYEAEAPTWSSQDFKFSYSVSTTSVSGGVLLQSPSLHDIDQRDMFCCYLYPGENQSGKVYSKEVVFVIDISASMPNLLMNVKNVILESLSRFTQQDSFNILAFNNEVHLFSSLMEPATPEAISNATQWISANFTASGGTDILFPLEQAMKLLAETTGSIPFIFLVTDGAVENEREICSKVKDHYSSGLPVCPRICTFGIGAYCNNYFLQMLSQIGRGYHDASYDA
ncbi:Proteasome subunit alpha type, partial [Psidium guajava]